MPVANGDRQAINTLEPWHDSGSKTLAKIEEDAKDIIVDDLAATLEAHRASNRTAVIRKIDTHGFPSPFKYPILKPHSDGELDVESIQEIKEDKPSPCQMWPEWPRDSVQAKQKYGRLGCTGRVYKGDLLEYVGSIQELQQPWEISNGYEDMYRQRPWLAYIENTGEDALERFVPENLQGIPFANLYHSLTNEIKAYEAYMRLSPQEEAASELVISDVNSVVRKESHIKGVTLLGSRSTGLASPISDFDFSLTKSVSLPGGRISLPSSQSFNRKNKLQAVQALIEVKKHFTVSSKFKDIEMVRWARVPILQSKHVATGLDVQIQTRASYQRSYECTLAYLSEFPSLRPLYIVIRYFLELRGLTTTFKGGLGSYSILMMIVTALKHSSGRFASDDLGGQLMHVLGFYGKANLYEVGFSADPPCVLKKKIVKIKKAGRTDPQLNSIERMQTLYPRKPYLLCLQDPANDMNDLGKNAYAIKHIQATFKLAHETLQSVLEGSNETSDDRANGKTLSYLDHLLRADYRSFESHRSGMDQGAKSSPQMTKSTQKGGFRRISIDG